MEKSALVIIDVDNAIANGYASLFADVLDVMEGVADKHIFIDRVLKLEGNQLTFPDFRFRSDSGLEVDVELFHQWHRSQLAERLDYMEKHPETPLLLGADRVCVKKDEALKERFERLRGNFLFSSFPGVENTVKALNRYAASVKVNG